MLLASCHALHMPSSNPPSSLVGQSLLVAPTTPLPRHCLRSGSAHDNMPMGISKAVSRDSRKEVADMSPDIDAPVNIAAAILS